MATVNFRELLDSRGGSVAYAMTVGGYPWVICSTPDLANALKNGGMPALNAMTKMFGTQVDGGGQYIAGDVDAIFTGLGEPGKTSWSVDESKGLTGGNFTVVISDQTLGHDWAHSPDDFEGIEGIHRIGRPLVSSSIGWGFLDETFNRDDTTFKIVEQSGSKIKDRVDALAGNDYVLLWVNNECVAVTSASLSGSELTLTVGTAGDARGLFMSPHAHHFTSYYTDADPIVSDVPTSIVDKPCYIWAIGLDQSQTCYQLLTNGDCESTTGWNASNGAVLTADDTSPYEQKYALRVTYNGVANPAANQVICTAGKTYRVTGWARGNGAKNPEVWDADLNVLWTGTSSTSWQSFNVTFLAPGTRVYFVCDTSAAGWAEFDYLTVTEVKRPPFNGTPTEPPRIIVQPKKVMWGKVSPSITHREGKTTIRCLSPFSQLDNEIKLPTFEGNLARYVLSRHASADADTSDAINYRASPHLVLHEWNTSTSQWATACIWLCDKGSTAAYDTMEDLLQAIQQELTYCKNGSASQTSGATGSEIQTLYAYNFSDNGYLVQSEGPLSHTPNYKYSTAMSGPLAFLCNLGLWGGTKGEYLAATRQSFLSIVSVSTIDGQDEKNVVNTGFLRARVESNTTWVPGLYMTPPWMFQAQYLVSWLWDDYHLGAVGQAGSAPAFLSTFPIAGTKLYLRKDQTLDPVDVGDELMLGYEGDSMKRYAEFTVGSKGTTNGYPHTSVSSLTSVDDDSFYVGEGIYFMPYMEYINIPKEERSNTLKLEWGQDPWAISQSVKLSSNNVKHIFESVLGRTGGNYISVPANQTLSHVVGFWDDGDFDSCIDWDDLGWRSKNLFDGLRWRLNLSQGYNFKQLLMDCILFCGLSPVWEWDDATDQFMMRFRPISVTNRTSAIVGGRELTEDMIKYGSTQKGVTNDTWLFNALNAKMNNVDGNYKFKVNVEYASPNAMNRSTSKKLSIQSDIARIKNYEFISDENLEKIRRHFGNILRVLAVPEPVWTATTTLASVVNHGPGSEIQITDRAAYDPSDHSIGLTNYPGIVTKLGIDLNRSECAVTSRLAQEYTYGWAPAAFCDANNSTKDGIVGAGPYYQVTCTTETHEFTPSNDRPDCMYFDCYNYNRSTGEYTDRDCSCSSYAVRAYRVDVTADTSSEILDALVQSVSSDGTMVLYLTATPYGNWDTTKQYVIKFQDWDSVEVCQQYFICGADQTNGTLGTAGDPGMRWI